MWAFLVLFAIVQPGHGLQPSTPARDVTLAHFTRTWADLPLLIQTVLAIFATISSILVFTRVYTTIRYRRALTRFLAAQGSSSKEATPIPLQPPPIPYTIPFLGSARSFLAPKSGLFWQSLFSFHPRDAGCCTLRLGPRTAYILHNPASVQALFKSKNADRLQFNIDIARRSLKVPEEDIRKYHGTDKRDKRLDFETNEFDPEHLVEKVNMDTLLKTDAVNELTAEFCNQLKKQLKDMNGAETITLNKWLREHMFQASGRALMGDKIFEYYPAFGDQFWDFERHMLSLFFGIPEFLLAAAVEARDQAIAGIVKWHEGLERDGLSEILDSTNNVPWEPNYGSRANRARQEAYNKMGLSRKAKAGFDLGFTFGLASNAIPATGWMLSHIVDPNADKTLFPRVMAELESARSSDGGLNLPVLFALPLFQSILHEVLRLYADILVSRSLGHDHLLPVSGPGNRQILLQKGNIALAPSWVGQHDSAVWTEQPHDVFYPERFLTTNPETGKDVFSLTATAGRFFPFGGGKTICPGRVFAKQEVLAATALMLLEFDFEFENFVDSEGKETKKFPGLRDGLGGSGVIVQAGDLKLNVKRRVH